MEQCFIHNMDTCVGCSACQVACKDHNNLQPGEFFRRVAEVALPGNGKAAFCSVACNHCEQPACIEACPNGAFYKAPDGTVLHDDGRCIGCGKCRWACPYGAISLSKEKGTAQKCDGCYDRRLAGLEPACVAACINRSLQWGNGEGTCTLCLPGMLPPPEQTGPRARIRCTQLEEE